MPKTPPAWCEELATLLEERAKHFLSGTPYDQDGKVMSLFQRYRNKRYRAFVHRWQYAEFLLERVANQDLIAILVSDLKGSDAKRRTQAFRLVKKLSTAASSEITDLVLKIRDPHLRKLLAHSLRASLGQAREHLATALRHPSSKGRLARTLATMADIGQGEFMMQSVRDRFSSYPSAMKLRVLRTLKRLHTPPAIALLAQAIEDDDPAVRREAFAYFKQNRTSMALGVMKRLVDLPTMPTDPMYVLQVEAVRALGGFSDVEARRLLMDLTHHENGRLRVTAMEALKRFDHRRPVRTAARVKAVVSTIL